MSILLYRGTDGRDITIQNPTKEDWAECCRAVCERNRGDLKQAVADGMKDSLFLTLVARQGALKCPT